MNDRQGGMMQRYGCDVRLGGVNLPLGMFEFSVIALWMIRS